MSQVIRVDPSSLRSYATKANQLFADARGALSALVHEAAEVHYFGPNAQRFKQECSTMATSLANSLMVKHFKPIADAVQTSTSNIAASLGGSPIALTIDTSPLALPTVPAATEVVDIDTSALGALKGSAAKQINRVKDDLQQNLTSLQATDWVGDAKNNAVTAVSSATRNAQAACDDALSQMSEFITRQIDAATTADR